MWIVEWEQRKLTEVAEIFDGDRGKNYPSREDFNEVGHTLFLSAANVTKNGFSFKSNQYITEEKSNLLGNGKINLNDIILTSRGSIGHIAWYNSHVKEKVPFARINSGMLILCSKTDYSASYIVQYLKSPLGKKQITLLSFGSAQPQLTKKDISNYKISVPIKDEQKKLGQLFIKLDNTIALHQQKLELLKQNKKGFLQKMFPIKEKSVPEIRFPEFSNKWKEEKLGDLFSYEQPTKYLVESAKYNDNYDIPVLTAGKTFILGYTNETKGVYNSGDVILFDDFTTDFRYIYFPFKIKSSATKLLTTNNKNNLRFLFEAMKGIYYPTYEHKRYWISEYTTLKLFIPSIEEQQKIGNFFKHLDDKITLHEENLETLKQTKKALLQKMFI